MQIFIDESGSINNHLARNKDFVIALVLTKDCVALRRAHKRFVSNNLKGLQTLDAPKVNSATGQIIREGGKMFHGEKFKELKGAQFDAEMKRKFVDFFIQKPHFELFLIRIKNARLTDHFCANTARVFNYALKQAMGYWIQKGLMPNEDCDLHLDERNERTETKHFLQEYLNTELTMENGVTSHFSVRYHDSSQSKCIQIADVLANLYYSHLISGAYTEQIKALREANILKHTFEFPLH